jgi:S1-C subfamily serine protease
VKPKDGRQLDGTVVGTDPQTDLAVLQIKGDRRPTLKLAEGDDIRVEDWVLAYESPFGLEHTMTAGIAGIERQGTTAVRRDADFLSRQRVVGSASVFR